MATTTISSVQPQKPWKATPAEIMPTILLLIGSMVATFAIVALTPMKGKLAYFFLFFVLGTVSISVRTGLARGRTAAVDSIASAIAFTGAAIVFMPVASILFTTIQKGVAGLLLSFLVDLFFLNKSSMNLYLTFGSLLLII